MAMALCVVCASPRGVGVDRRRACPHRFDVGALVHSSCQWWCDPLGDNGSCEVVCVNRGRRTHIGYPKWSGGLGDEGTILWHSLVGLRRCGDGLL